MQQFIPYQNHYLIRSPFVPPISPKPFSTPLPAPAIGKESLLTRLLQRGGEVDLATILTNTQRVIQFTERATPFIQQYGPIIRHLPTIWKIMREGTDDEVELSSENHAKVIDDLPMPKLYI